MMLRTLAVLGLSTATVTATMASVKDGVARPTRAARATEVAPDPFEGMDFNPLALRSESRPVTNAGPFTLTKTPSAELLIPRNAAGPVTTGNLLVKFRNDLGVRASLYPAQSLISNAGWSMDEVVQVLEPSGATIRQLIHKSPAELDAIEAKIEAYSGKVQPDLASLMLVQLPDGITEGQLLDLAVRLNDRPEVEWLGFEGHIMPAGLPGSDTPDWVSGPWGDQSADPFIPTPDFTLSSMQQYQIGTSDDPAVDREDPTTWFGTSLSEGAGGYDLPRVIRLAGQTWRRYGSPPTNRDVFQIGTDFGGQGFFGTLPQPTKVWMYGAEFEIVDSADCDAGLTDYDCAECFAIDPSDGAIKDENNPFPEFATDPSQIALYPGGVYGNIRFCPTGRKTMIGIVDYAAFRNHEEFIYGRGGALLAEADRPVSFEEGQTMNLLTLDEIFHTEASHGTASIGVVVAGNNNFGLVGMTWATQARFYPSASLEEGARLATALSSAINDLDPGSILAIPLCTTSTTGDPDIGSFAQPEAYSPPGLVIGGGQFLSSNGAYALLISSAADGGLVVVQAAGNAGLPLETDASVGEDEGAKSLIVTAATPSGTGPLVAPFGPGVQTRYPGSNYFTDDSDNPANDWTVSGWGGSVPSLGYGNLYRNSLPPEGIDPADIDPLERDFLRSYTGGRESRAGIPPLYPNGTNAVMDGYDFGDSTGTQALWGMYQGTSCATMQIAGLAAWMQGFGRMFYDTDLAASQLASIFGAGGDPTNQLEWDPPVYGDDGTDFIGCIPPCAGGNVALGLDGAVPAGIPLVPSGPSSALGVVNAIGQNFSGSLIVHWGTRIRGNGFSVGTEGDGNTLEVRSKFAAQGPGPVNLTYLVSGQSTDIGVILPAGPPAEEIISMSLTVTRRANLTVVIEIPWARNNVTGRYDPLGVELMPTVLEPGNYAFEGITSQIPAYVNGSGDVDIRLYTVGLGFIGAPTYTVEYDFIELNVNEDNAPL